MIAKPANELIVVSLAASTVSELEDSVNDWLKEQLENVTVHDISFQHSEGAGQTAWLVITHDS